MIDYPGRLEILKTQLKKTPIAVDRLIIVCKFILSEAKTAVALINPVLAEQQLQQVTNDINSLNELIIEGEKKGKGK